MDDDGSWESPLVLALDNVLPIASFLQDDREADVPSDLASQYKELIATPDALEEVVHQFISVNPSLLLQSRNDQGHHFVISRPMLGADHVADFLMYGGCNYSWMTFVEIEKPGDSIFTRNGDYSAALTHALRQVKDWREWIRRNPDTFRESFCGHFADDVFFEVIIGRRRCLRGNTHKVRDLGDGVRISTFDSLVPRRLEEGRYPQRQIRAITFQEFKTLKQVWDRHDPCGFRHFLVEFLPWWKSQSRDTESSQ